MTVSRDPVVILHIIWERDSNQPIHNLIKETKAGIWFALPTTRSMWEVHEILLLMSTPRYLAQVTVSNTWP